MSDDFITSLAIFWFLFQLHSCFHCQDTVDQYLSIYQLLQYVSVVTPVVYQVRHRLIRWRSPVQIQSIYNDRFFPHQKFLLNNNFNTNFWY